MTPSAPGADPRQSASRSTTPAQARANSPVQWPDRLPASKGPTKSSRQRNRVPRRPNWKVVAAVVLVLLISWPAWLVWHVDRSMERIDALPDRPNTPGTTYLFAGSDSRDGWNPDDPTEGERSDSAILIHKAPNGQTSMVSLPRDTYIDIPGYGWNKFNAAFAFGGPKLMVETTEQMTGLTVDYYVQIGMGGVGEIVDALGGVDLCWDADVSDPYSGMEWVAGCHKVNGEQALAFSRMRYADPTGDVGRTERQRQLLGVVASDALSLKTLLNPLEQLRLGNATSKALTVSKNTHIWNVAFLLLAMRKASAAGLTGAPPISEPNAMVDVGSVMILDEARAPQFFEKMSNGTLTPEDFKQSWG